MSKSDRQLLTIPEVQKLPEGSIVDAVAGKLLVTGARLDKTRPDGTAYTSQSFTLFSNAGMLTGLAYDHYPLEPYDKQPVIFVSMKARNGRYGGVTTAKSEGSTSLFSRHVPKTVLRVSKLGVLHTPDTYKTLCQPTPRDK